MTNKKTFLLKYVPKKEYADALMNGVLFCRPACYYRLSLNSNNYDSLQFDIAEGAISNDECIYYNDSRYIYCMSISQLDSFDNCISLSNECIKDFNCENGYIVLINYNFFISKLSSLETGGYALTADIVKYKDPTINDVYNFFAKTDDPLFYKRPSFKYQNEYRIVIEKNAPFDSIKNIETSYRNFSFNEPLFNCAMVFSIAELPMQNGRYCIPIDLFKSIAF